MPRKKQTESRPLKEQIEEYIFEGSVEFEQLSGLQVDRIEVKHHRPAGFGAKPIMEVNIIVES